jgi:TP901 family phage tail tape measure protein
MSASKVRAGQAFVEIGADPRKLFAALGKLNSEIGKIGKSMVGLGGRMTAIGAAIGAPIGLAVGQFASFDDAIRATAAVSGATGGALQSLNDTARELGATTSFTAVQVANLMTELGRAGFKPDEIEAMTGAVLDLARATGTDATLASGIMAATLRQFSLGATDAGRAADVLTKAANSTFNTVEGLGESLKYAGPVAKSLGMSLEDTAAILGVLGNVGIQGSEAGTALRRLSVIAAGAGEELQKIFGVTNVDAAGNLKPLVDILDEINQVTANMPVAERTAKMAQAFGLLGITSANVLSESADGVRGLAESLRGAAGTAATAAKEMDAGLGGSIRILLSAIEGTALAIGDALAPSMQVLAQYATELSGGLTAMFKANDGLVVSIAKGVTAFSAAGIALVGLGSALQLVSFGLGGLINAASLVVAPIVGIITTLAGLVASFVSATAGVLAYSAASVAAAVASGTAWAVANAPLLALVAVLAAAGGFVFYLMGGFEGIASTIGGGFNSAISDATTLLSDLGSIGKTTFSGLYEAIAGGDLQGAMDIAMAGLYAAWARGSEAIMGSVDSWAAFIQNTVTYMWAGIKGVFGDSINFVLNAFDDMVSAVQQSWNYVQSFIKKGFDLAAENKKVTDATTARKQQRAATRGSGVEMRAADGIAAGRLDENVRRADERRANTVAAEDRLGGLVSGQRDQRIFRAQADAATESLGTAGTMDEVRALAEEFHLLAATGKVTQEQLKAFSDAAETAQDRIEGERGAAGAAAAAPVDPEAVKMAATAAAASQSEVAGSFSAASISGMGFGQSLAQKQLDTLKEIAANTALGGEGLVAD